MGESLVDDFAKTCEFDQVEVVTLCGSELLKYLCTHLERESPILEAEYVTMESELMHIAPGLGR